MALLRAITAADDVAIASVIRSVLAEHNVPLVGTALADPQLDCMSETYNLPRSMYYVVEVNGEVFGGGGVAPLKGSGDDICEMQKMYFHNKVRGLGLGRDMIELCLDSARRFNFKKCYLETMPYMLSAQKLYEKVGFTYLDSPLGCTGHTSCPVWMIKEL